MVKKYLFGFGLMLLTVFNLANAQGNQEAFPNNRCISIDAVYLSHKDTGELKLFPVQPDDNNENWGIFTDFRARAADYTTLGGLAAADHVFKSDDVVQRFNFGTIEEPVFKKYCVEFQEAIPVGENGELAKSIGGDSGIDLIKNYVAMIYKTGVVLLGLICVLVMVVSGIQISAGGASPDKVSDAKSRIAQALFSLILLFASAMILKAINPGFFL